MHVNQKPRRRHSEQLKSQVLAACAEPGASVSAVALSCGLNANLVHQWRRGRGFKTVQATAAASKAAPQFVALSLPPPLLAAAEPVPAQAIRVEVKRAELSVTIAWPLSAAGDCAAWLRELWR